MFNFKVFMNNSISAMLTNTFFKPGDGSIPIGTPARKVGGSFQAEGVIVGNFKTTEGAQRYVFEFTVPKGMLHIYRPSQLEVIG